MIGVIALACSGCYVSHERADAGSEPDAFVAPDAFTPIEPEDPQIVGRLSAPRIFPRLLAVGDRIVIAAGAGFEGDEPLVLEVYDPRAVRVSPDPDLPSGPVGAAYFVDPTSGALAFAGGLGFDAALGPMGAPSDAAGRIAGGRIEALDPLPQPSGWPAVGELDGRPVLITGLTLTDTAGYLSHEDMHWLDRDGRWRRAHVSDLGVVRGGVVARAGEIVFTGGLESAAGSGHGNVGRIMGSADAPTIRFAQRMSSPRAGHAAVLDADGQRVIVIGGVNRGRAGAPYVQALPIATVERDDVVGGSRRPWIRLPDLPHPLAFLQAFVTPDGTVVALGGTSEPLSRARGRSELLVLDPGADAWRVIETTLEPRYAHGIAVLDDGWVLIAGGLRAPGEPVLEVERVRVH